MPNFGANMTLTTRATLVAAGFALVVVPLWSQKPSPQKASFEVASVKFNRIGGPANRIERQPGGPFVATNITLRILMRGVYRVFDAQIVGGPNWITTDGFDIDAKVGGEQGRLTLEQLQPFVESLLEDRFQLKMHREMRKLRAYELVVAKGGLKMKRSVPGTKPTRGGTGRAGGTLTATAQPIDFMIPFFAAELGAPLFDKTGLNGLFDYSLEWEPEANQAPAFRADGPIPTGPPRASDDPRRPSIFTAFQDQLGLRLQSARRPVEVLVIDRIKKPSEN
jgi:uncharacterized protein (TIGR03435 family)